ncbi:histidine kinase [Erythrobacter sp. SG61-1L]|uniref:sensor histidine kinase n=1 Tax=Erythrobacter sp. SG61-1L TaxID=1603897 RepID=UPI0006C9127F|nr:ATP-binding protein [Erythrobacter sp. SG61-1L]KPL68581.1 histidine kinase [Erythrobacter sp. SG61-1L]
MDRRLSAYLLATLGVGAIAWITASALPVLGLASSALLFLLPVLFASARGGIGPGLFAAIIGATAYNFLLLPPRFTFRIHGLDNIVSVVALVAVALVTSRLATRLKAREREALAQAAASAEIAALSALLTEGEVTTAPARGTAWLAEHLGHVRLIAGMTDLEGDAGFSALDLSAAAWAVHNGDITGHGSAVMPVAEWSFFPLSPRGRLGGGLLAVARPAEGVPRSEGDLAQLQALAFLLGQACDRSALEAERRERARIEESDRLRRALLASLAHDFRTPLTVIAGQLEALAATSPEAGEALAAARRLDRTIEDLFGAARLEDGSLSPASESLDLVDVATPACDAVPLPDHIALARAIPPDLPFVKADPVLLHHILINLIDNAARHAHRQVTIEAKADAGRVLLSVCDDGPGIPEAARERMFERFARLEGSDRRQGSGLGLAIVKGFADAMGIAVEISDAPGGGACFTLAMPPAEGTAQ